MPEEAKVEATAAMNATGWKAAADMVKGMAKALQEYYNAIKKISEVRMGAPGVGRPKKQTAGVMGAEGKEVTATFSGKTAQRNAAMIKLQEAALERLNEQCIETIQSFEKARAVIEKDANATRKAAEATKRLTTETEKVTRAKKRKTEATKKATDTTNKSAWALNRAQFQLRQFGRTLYFAGRDIIMFGAIITGVMGYALKTFADVEEQISRVEIRLQIMGKSAEESHRLARELADEAIRVGKEWGYGAREATKALASLSSAGITATKSIHILKQATILARINFISMDQATEVLVQYLKATGRTAKDAEVAIKELTVAQNNSFESLTSLAAGFGFAMTSLMEYGAASEDVAVAMTVFTKTGTSSTVAGRRLSSMYGHLTENGRKYGIQVKDAAGKTLEMKDMMLAVRERAEFFGDEMVRQQFLLEVLGITGKDAYEKMIKAIEAGEWDKMLAEFEDTEVAAGKLAGVVRDDLKIAFDRFAASVEGFLTVVGQYLAPWLITAADAIDDFVDALGDLEDIVGPVGGALLGLGVAATAVGIALAGIGMAISAGVGGWALGKGAIVKLGEALSGTATSSGLLKGGIVGLTAKILKLTIAITFVTGIIVGFCEYIGYAANKTSKDKKGGFGYAVAGVVKVIVDFIRVVLQLCRIIYELGRMVGITAGVLVVVLAALVSLVPGGKEVIEICVWLIELLGNLADGLEWLADGLEDMNDAVLGSEQALQDVSKFFDELGVIVGDTIWFFERLVGGLEFFTRLIPYVDDAIFSLTDQFWAIIDAITAFVCGLLGCSPGLVPALNDLKTLFEIILSPIGLFGGALNALIGEGPLELVKGVLEAIKGTLEWLQENTKFNIEISVDLTGDGADFLGAVAQGTTETAEEVWETIFGS